MSGWGWGGGPPPYTPSPPPILSPRRAASPRGPAPYIPCPRPRWPQPLPPGVPLPSGPGYASPTPRFNPSVYCPSPVPRFSPSPVPRPFYNPSPVMCPSPEYYFAPFEGAYSPAESSAASFTGVPLEPPGPPEDGRATADIIAAQSQDYVDEKLAEYQATIYHLQDEQERVQKKTFVNWINSYLSKRVPPLRVNDLIEDLKDGTKLLALLEVLSGERLQVERGRNLRRPHFLSNANTALQFLLSKKIKLVNINASDLVDGRPPVVLGLIWTIILYFQIEENTRALESLGHTFGGSASSLESVSEKKQRLSSPTKSHKVGAKRALLQWVTNALPAELGLEIRDFGPSWRDGLAFLGVIEAIKAGLIDIVALKSATNRIRLETAFDVAENELGIARLLDPEDVDVDRPDERSIMTYVAQFLHRYPEPRLDALANLQNEHSILVNWLLQKTQYLQHLRETNSLPTDYREFLSFKAEVSEKAVIYEKFSKLVDSQSIISITSDSWKEIERLWQLLESQMRHWEWLLDSKLPGLLGEVGDWLGRAENLIYSDDIPQVMNEETAGIISRKLEQHKLFFAELPNITKKFETAKNSMDARNVPREQLESIEKRLGTIGQRAQQRRVKLKFLEHKCCLIAFLHLTETKLKGWTVKYGREEKVQQLLEQYKNFVSRNKIFQEFNKAYIDMQQVVEEYKREGNIDEREGVSIDQFMRNTNDRWRSVSMELRCVQSMLEEVLAYWRRWNSSAEEFQEWLEKAYSIMDHPEEEKMEFFQDLSVWKDKHQSLNDTVSFLVATCEDSVVNDLRERFARMNALWEQLFPHVKQYMRAGDILRQRKDYRAGVEKLQNWLRAAEDTLSCTQLTSAESVKLFGEELQKLQNEIEGIEELFKDISKKFQALIPDLSREEVDRMMNTLKKEKEALVRVRALIPMQLHLYHQILVQQESLEAGQAELAQWLDNAEKLLLSHTLSVEPNKLRDQLDKHKQFFSRTLYYKSMLDSKNKVHQSIVKNVDQSGGPSQPQIIDSMKEINERFTNVIQLAGQWEQKLAEAIRCWEKYLKNEATVTDWLNQAESLANEKHIDTKQTVEQHKMFFQQVKENAIHDLVNAAQDLKNCLPVETQTAITKSVDSLQKRWREMLSFAPLHLMKLEFRLDEAVFHAYLAEMDKEICAEQAAIDRSEEISQISARSKQFFQDKNVITEVEKCLQNMNKIALVYTQKKPDDLSLKESYARALNQWETMMNKVTRVRSQLDQVPAQWSRYWQQFQEMVQWMDKVDQNIKNILKQVDTIEEFEKERSVFQTICREVESKREAIKWLVQTLDGLTSRRNDEESEKEQKLLEDLIARYKALIPTIEMTVTQTELFSKCYIYRKEAREVCSLLKRVGETSETTPHPETLGAVAQMISQQEAAVTQLDAQRPNIISMLQRGRELAKDPHAPVFVSEQVANLETGWNKAYNMTLEKLNKLKATQKVWQNYKDQKKEIVELLERAERELKQVKGKHSRAKDIANELRDKQELSKALRIATEELLKKLRELCQTLCTMTAPERKPLLQKEVTEVERRLQVTLETVQDRVVFLEQLNGRWTRFNSDLGELRDWTRHNAPAMVHALQSAELGPQERLASTQLLQRQIDQKAELLDVLDGQAQELVQEDEANLEAQQLRGEINSLKESLRSLKFSAEAAEHAMESSVACYEKHAAVAGIIKPWLEKAQLRTAAGIPKPINLQDAEDQLQQAKMFQKECAQYHSHLQEMALMVDKLPVSAVEETDILRTKFQAVKSNADQQVERLEKLIIAFEEFEAPTRALEIWVENTERAFAEGQLDLVTPQVAKLEDGLEKIKGLNKEIAAKQSELVIITNASDALCHGLALEGGTIVKNRVQELKAKVSQLADRGRQSANAVADVILERQEFNSKVDDFSKWMDELASRITSIETVPLADLDLILQDIHYLLQDHGEKQPAFNVIYDQVKSLASQATPEEAKEIEQSYTTLVAKYQSLEDDLQRKRAVLEKWSELLCFHSDISEQLKHAAFKAQDLELKPEKLSALLQEIKDIKSKIEPWKGVADEIDVSCEQSGLFIKDTAGTPTTAKQLLARLDSQSHDVDLKLGEQQQMLQAVQTHWSQFQDLQNSLSGDMLNAQEILQKILLNVTTSEKIPNAVSDIEKLIGEHNKLAADKDKLHSEGAILMREDQTNVETIQNILTSLDANWDKTDEKLRDQMKRLSEMNLAWQNFLDANQKLKNGFAEVKEILEEDNTMNILEASKAKSELANSRRCSEILKKCKNYLDSMAAKGQIILRLTDNLENFDKNEINNILENSQKEWKKNYDNILKRIQNLEAQNVMWEQIEEGKNEVLMWLKETTDGLTLASSDPELAQIKLAKYKDDLSTYWNLKMSVQAKANQLIKTNEDKNPENLKALIKLLDDEFDVLKLTANGLEELAFSFGEQEQAVKKEIKKAGDVISQIREAVVSCDDLTGDNNKILQRLNKVQGYQNDLKGFRDILDRVNATLHEMKSKYPSFGDSSLAKELSSLEKRYESVVSHANKVEINLLTFLKKYYDEKFSSFQRNLLALNEKLQWCLPEPSSDQYNLGLKLSSLKDVENGIEDCENKKSELDQSLQLLQQVETPDKINQLTFDKEKLMNDLQELKENCKVVGEKLRKSAALWEKYEKTSENISAWLKDCESKIRSESCNQLDLTDIQQKIKETETFHKELIGHEPEINELLAVSEEILKESPESRTGQHCAQLSTRYQSAIKFVISYIERLQNLQRSRELYNDSVQDGKKWIEESEEKLKKIENNLKASPKSLSVFQKQVAELKEFEKDRERGQTLLNVAVEKGEALFSGIIPENRELIRAELRALRNSSEALLDRANVINKRIEAILMQRSSFDDSYSQVEKWFHEAKAKLGPSYQLKPTLQEKKLALHNYRALHQDVASHKNILGQLQDKIASISDEESNAKLENMLKEYENLISTVEGRIKIAENHVLDHEKFLQALEKSHDWLETLKTEAAPILCVVNIEKDDANVKLETLENLMRHKPEGDELLQVCHERLQVALEGTDPVGQAALLKEYEDQNRAWNEFLEKCADMQGKLCLFCSKFTELEAKVEDLTNWTKNQELQVKDQSLKSTTATKQQHLTKLRNLENEMMEKNEAFNEILDQSHDVERDSELAGKISKLLARYQNLKTSVRESISRYEGFVREHKAFDESYVEFEQWLAKVEAELIDCSEIVGDVTVLQERQKKMRDLSDLKAKENATFDKLLDSGEKLYTHTSPDGRELIRQQLRTLRTKWDRFAEDIQSSIQKLDACLVQFAEFALQQEQLTTWLKDVEKAMQQHTELKNSLQEKRAQLQNHRIVHQEITAHQSLVEGVCDKAKRLVEQTKDTSLNIYLQSIKQLFHDIVVQSQVLLDNLQGNVDKDTKFTTQCKNFRDWLSSEKDKLQECSEITGEKSDLAKRLVQVKTLRDNLKEGDEKLIEIRETCAVVCKSTAPKGIAVAEKELADLVQSLQQFADEIGIIEKKLESALQEWKDFESRLDTHTKWFRSIEAVFREQKLFSSLSEKEAQLASYKEQRCLITEQEPKIDEFVDRSHILLNSSGAERIKPLISQISNRYQLLHVLSKEVINRWQGLVDDHKSYEDKLQETNNWLTPLEEHLRNLQEDCDLQTKQAKLKILLSEREQAAHRLTSLTVMAEKLYPDTAAPGREQIRNTLRSLRDRWDKLEEGIMEQQKKQEAVSLQWASYQETLNQTLAWLSQMEAGLACDPGSWSSTQEIRSKLLKNKTTLQEVLSHKRIIENVSDKANAMKGTVMYNQIIGTVQSINKRYEELIDGYLKNITQLEDSLSAFQAFNDLLKSHQDYQKQLWDLLAGYSDYSGSKAVLEGRLAKIIEIQDSLPEAEAKLESLNKHVTERTGSLPARAREAMERDLNNLRYDHNKFSTRLSDVRHGLEERLRQWNDYEGSFEHLLAWLSEAESTLKNYAPRSTLQEKQEQLDKYQSLILSVRQNEADFDKMSDVSSELAQSSGDSRVSVNVQQITSRFQSIQSTAKDIVKKCEEAVEDHKTYLDKYKQCSDWLAAATSRFDKLQSSPTTTRSELIDKSSGLKELLLEQPTATSLVNSTVEMGEKLYPQTAMEGRDIVRKQLEELQNALEVLYDGVAGSERELQAKLSRWSGFEESSKQLLKWLEDVEKTLPDELELKTTLDEKRAMLMSYRSILHDINNHQHDLVALKGQMEALPERNEKAEQQFKYITDRHSALLKKAGNVVEKYEAIVSSHQQYSKAVMDLQEWLEATHNTVQLWGDAELERISLHTNLERLKNLQRSLPEEEPRIEEIRALAEKVIPGTVESGQVNIRTQVDSSQQEWESLLSTVNSTIEVLEAKLQQWAEYEQLKDHCLSWLRETDTKLHAVDLKATVNEKRDQLEALRKLQGEVRAKELEMDSVTERAQQLCKGRSSLVSELGVKYQQISHKVKDLTNRWHQYVSTHQEFESQTSECLRWLEDIREKLAYCSDLSASSQKDLETKLETIQDLLLYKEEGFSKVQGAVELAQAVLANTAPSGHDAINEMLGRLQEEWSSLASKMIETKAILDDSIHRWAGFLEQIHELNKTVEYLENSYKELSEFQTTMSEKRAQLEKIKTLDEKARCERVEVDGLKAKAREMLASGQQSHAASQAKEILDKFDVLVENIKKLLDEREDQYRDHRLYKEAHDDLIGWLSRAREKVPSMKQRPLSDKLALEHAVAPLESLLNKQAQGELLLEHLHNTGEVLLASTSPQGQESIKNEMRALTESFHGLFKEIAVQKDQLEAMVLQWRSYKEEYERLSDWLQQIDILVKAQKIALLSTVKEKEKQVEEVKEILDRLEKGQSQIELFNQTASVLLASHLDTYVNNQLRHLNSRYQVQINLAKDVLKKVETNYEQHMQYETNLKNARAWIENAKEIVWTSSENASLSTSKEELQARLNKIQELLKRREEGQNLMHLTVNCGEKVLRNTKSDGRDVINNQLKELQTDWDRLVRKISTAKVHLETGLLQWADYSSSYSQLQQWITDREAKLQQVCEQKMVKAKKGQAGLSNLSIGERKATLRQTNSIVQDIVSFEPMIQSVASKAEDLLQAQPASEISTKYESLSKQARELYAKQKETVEQHQAFIDAGNEFVQWIRGAKEKLGKCSEPTGDKEALSSKAAQLTVLHAELPEGQVKLEKALSVAAQACQLADPEDKDIIEEEVALLQEELDIHVESLARTRQLVEAGIVRWTEYEDQYKDACDWLAQTETLVQGFNKLQDSLEEKKVVLEQFQIHLQTLFDWQKELDRLNMKAQVLLETCADTRVSNAVTQMTTKYNALLSMAKEVMRRLELHYQEHQQHNSLYQECQDWAERTRDKLNECAKPVSALADAQSKLQTVKAIRQSLETGQNKLRYALELKEKVIMNTEQTGAAKIQEDTENLKTELDRLFNDVEDLRTKLGTRVSQLEDLQKSLRLLTDWLDEAESKASGNEAVLNDLSEKKALLERFKSLLKDVNSHGEMVNKISAKVNDDPSIAIKEFDVCIERYNNLKALIAKKIGAIESQVVEHEKYKQAYMDACDWLRKTRIEIQQCSDPHGEKEETLKKEGRVNAIIATLGTGEKLVENAVKLSEHSIQNSGPEGQDAIKQELNQLRSDWEGVNFMCKDTQKTLTKCIAFWKDFADTYDKMKDWLSDCEKRVEVENQKGEKRTPEDLEIARNLLTEATNQKIVLEELNDRCESLMDMCACNWVRDKTVQLQGVYTHTLTAIQSLLSRVEKNLSDHTDFIKARDEFDVWLTRSHGTVQDCIGVGDEAQTKDRLETVKLVSQRLTEGQLLMSKMQDAFAKAVETTPGDQQDFLREEVARLRASWEQLNIDLNSIQAQLKSTLSRWEDFNENQNRFERWVVEKEEVLNETPNTKGELGEMKTLLERLRHLQDEIDGKGEEISDLLKDAQQLVEWSQKSGIVNKVKQLKSRWEELSKKCKSRKELIDKEIAEYCAYHQRLQDTEKWLLQISFQLIAHNSLYITSREQTQEQVSQHEALLGEIQRYQTDLDDLREKGRAQIDRYVGTTPNIQTAIEKQLKNVQDNYDSLLNTAIQIKNRLLESLAKFKEYEDTLDIIMRNLDALEPVVMEEVEVPITSLKSAQNHLENARDLHNRLQNEKTRLAMAVQACEAAAACISRPSSPLEAVPPSIPDKELAVRARMEDLIDQIQTRLSSLGVTLGEMEEWKKQREALYDWIAEQRTVVNDWKSKPAKLRPESAKQELKSMHTLLALIADKRAKLLTELPSHGELLADEPNLEESLDSLEEELLQVIAKKQNAQQIMDDYRGNLAEAHQWLDSIVKRMENLEKGGPLALDCNQRLAGIQELAGEIDTQGNQRIEDVKKLADQVIDVVSNLDSQQVDEQLKSLERRHNDISKRVQRKAQVLESTNKGVEGAKQEVQQVRDWVKSKMDCLKSPEPMGFTAKQIGDKFQALKALMKEVDGKQVIIEALEKRIGNMATELEPPEVQQLESLLKNLSSEHCELTTRLRGEMDKIHNASQAREKFEGDVEGAQAWIRNKLEQVNKIGNYLPLKSTTVQQQINEYKGHDNSIKHFGDTTLAEIEKQAHNFMKDCSDEDKGRLQGLMADLNENYNKLKKECKGKLAQLSDLLAGRKQFEDDLGKCEKWLDEANVATSTEIRSPNVNVLEEQLAKYDRLNKESENIAAEIEKCCEQGKAILPTLNEADKLTLQAQLSAAKDKHARIAGIIKDRTDGLKDTIQQYKDAAQKVQQSIEFMTKIQKEIKELNRPVSAKVEEVQGMLNSYEKILNELKDYRAQLGDLEECNLGELANIVAQQDDLIKAIEDQIARLRQLLLLREQFMALIQEITTFIAKYTEIVRDIEKGGHSVQEKIKRYDDVIVKIQECEALLASATDKGQQIAAEGSASDRNSVTETLTSLKQQLQQLRRAVERQREQHEMSLAAHGKLAQELDDVLDALHDLEGDVKSRPLLLRDPSNVDDEIQKHKTLAGIVEDYLNRIRGMQESTRHEEGLPGSLLEKLSEANSLLSTLPIELNERFKYLENNKQLRLDYQTLKEKLHKWINEAEEKIQKGRFGVNFESVFADLEEHKAFFSCEPAMLELVSQLQHAGDKVWPSLSQEEQEELSKELQEQNQLLKNTLNSAKSRRAQLEQDCEIYREYVQSRDKVKSVLSRTKFVDEPVETLAGLHFNIQKLTHALNDINNQQSELDLLTEKSNELEKQADPESKTQLQENIKEINDEWRGLVNSLETRRETLSVLAQHWEQFEAQLQLLENNVCRIEEKAKLVDMVIRSKPQLEETRNNLQILIKELEGFSPELEELAALFSPVKLFLDASSPSSAKALKEKVDTVTKSSHKLLENLHNKSTKLSNEADKLEGITKEIENFKRILKDLERNISELYVFGENQDLAEAEVKNLKSEVEDGVHKAKNFCANSKDDYNKLQQFVPTDISQELTALELLSESVNASLEEKCREQQRAKTVRSDYVRDVDVVQSWIQKSELAVQDRSVEPQQLKQHIQEIQSEITGISEKLEKAKKNGQVIIDHTKDDLEKDVVKGTLETLESQLSQLRTWMDQTRQTVGDSLDSWQRFMSMYNAVMAWVAEKKIFLELPLQLGSLTEARQKLNDYSMAVKSCKTMGKNLSDMSKELDAIAAIGSVSDLPEKLTEAEEAKAEVEALILERNALLSETSEEWEQCEKKMKDVRSWLDKSRSALDSPTYKKRPLRDQLAAREKMLADIAIQKTKISISVEKLQVHFRSGIGGDRTVVAAAEDILQELDQLLGTVKEQVSNFEECIAQLDQYQQEIQLLRQQIVQAEQQLRATLSPAFFPQDRERARQEQEALRERVKLLQCKMSARVERVKLLSVRGTPDTETLKDSDIFLRL